MSGLRIIVCKDEMTKRTLITNGYEAEFFVDTRHCPMLYHYVVTRQGSAEILHWGQEFSMEEAERAAMDWMHIEAQRAVAG